MKLKKKSSCEAKHLAVKFVSFTVLSVLRNIELVSCSFHMNYSVVYKESRNERVEDVMHQLLLY